MRLRESGRQGKDRAMCHARRVLVVEDTPALRQLLAQALADEG
jgi:hypothetical protein